MRKICILLICMFCLGAVPFYSYASDENSDIVFKDYSGIVSDSAKNYINRKNEKLYDVTGARIVFVTVNSTEGLSAQEYCERLYAELGLKKSGRNNSVLCVVAPNEKDYGFEQGANISLTLTDDLIDEFIVEYFEPNFRKKCYDEAVLKTFNALAGWYEDKYTSLNLSLDKKIRNHMGGAVTKDIMEKPNRILMWAGIGVGLVVLIVIMKIKRNIDLQIRQHERRKLKKKYKIDLDKAANS